MLLTVSMLGSMHLLNQIIGTGADNYDGFGVHGCVSPNQKTACGGASPLKLEYMLLTLEM